MRNEYPDTNWQTNWLKPRLPWNKQAIKPAEIGDGLCKVMMAPKNILEDANYNKVLPNHFIVELSPENYAHHYEPLRNSLPQQWHERLVEHLMTANSRLGRKEHRFGGQILVELRSASDLKDSQARILCRVEPDFEATDGKFASKSLDRGEKGVFLELIQGGQRWPLHPGDNIIGRDEDCDIFLKLPQVQEKRLISAKHAFIRVVDGRYYLYDGSPSGQPSANGTFLNARRVLAHGEPLQDGDIIILAAIHPHAPRPDTPGVAAFRFQQPGLNAN